MTATKKWLTVFLGVFVTSGALSAAFALPMYARKYDQTCNQCHSAWPTLNEYGREFKMNGYRPAAGPEAPKELKKVDDRLYLELASVLSARLVGRPYDKSGSAERANVQPAHEIELYLSGNFSREFSLFTEIESEPEDGSTVVLENLVGGWHPLKEANVVAGIGQVFFADPYNTLKDGGSRMTTQRRSPLNTGFASGNRLRDRTQFITFNGRVQKFYYSATIASDDEDGSDAKGGVLRGAYDFPFVHVGAFYQKGRTDLADMPDVTEEFRRTGLDVQVEAGDFTLLAVGLKAKDDDYAGLVKQGEHSDNAGYIEGFYSITKGDDPLLVPLVRYETAESNDGEDRTAAAIAAIKWYARSNIELTLEYLKQVKVPDLPGGQEGDKNHRTTLFFNLVL